MGESAKARSGLLLEPGTLWDKATERTQSALECGALHPIPTQTNFIEQDGICFLVRILANLARKAEAKKRQEQQVAVNKNFNPFLPYDPDLFVTDLTDTHLCLLNKYNVVDHHLLIITRQFEDQETLLTLNDFEALWYCLTEIEGLGFYNSGKMAGASQSHKHLQLVPLPLTPRGEPIPVESVFASVVWNGGVGTSPVLPFQHALIRFDSGDLTAQQSAQSTLDRYLELLSRFDLYGAGDARPKGAYNLLVTRRWMLLIPRSQEKFETIEVNALGFAGTLFVRNQQQFEHLKSISPLVLLKQVAVANQPD